MTSLYLRFPRHLVFPLLLPFSNDRRTVSLPKVLPNPTLSLLSPFNLLYRRCLVESKLFFATPPKSFPCTKRLWESFKINTSNYVSQQSTGSWIAFGNVPEGFPLLFLYVLVACAKWQRALTSKCHWKKISSYKMWIRYAEINAAQYSRKLTVKHQIRISISPRFVVLRYFPYQKITEMLNSLPTWT